MQLIHQERSGSKPAGNVSSKMSVEETRELLSDPLIFFRKWVGEVCCQVLILTLFLISSHSSLFLSSFQIYNKDATGIAVNVFCSRWRVCGCSEHRKQWPTLMSQGFLACYEPEEWQAPCVLQGFVSVLDTQAAVYVWDQCFMQRWNGRVVEDFCLALVFLLRDKFLATTDYSSMKEACLKPTLNSVQFINEETAADNLQRIFFKVPPAFIILSV